MARRSFLPFFFLLSAFFLPAPLRGASDLPRASQPVPAPAMGTHPVEGSPAPFIGPSRAEQLSVTPPTPTPIPAPQSAQALAPPDSVTGLGPDELEQLDHFDHQVTAGYIVMLSAISLYPLIPVGAVYLMITSLFALRYYERMAARHPQNRRFWRRVVNRLQIWLLLTLFALIGVGAGVYFLVLSSELVYGAVAATFTTLGVLSIVFGLILVLVFGSLAYSVTNNTVDKAFGSRRKHSEYREWKRDQGY